MPRFELSITADYAPRWSIWEGIREIVQNAMDGQDEGWPMEIEHDGLMTLRVTNKGLRLDGSVWLLGKSTKRGNDALRGQHGDGLKVGMLALVRQGVNVWIMNGSERWTPSLETSETFAGETVLAINTRKGSKRDEDFSVYVEIGPEAWRTMRHRFIPLAGIRKDEMERVYGNGAILYGTEFAGDIYSKGIWVCRKPDLPVGYDLYDLDLDRDRRIVDDYELAWSCARLHSALINRAVEQDNKTHVETTYARMLRGTTTDLDRLGSYLRDDHAELFVELFERDFGKNARPVLEAGQATKLEYYGLKGVVVPAGLHNVLSTHYGSFERILVTAIQDSGSYIIRSEMTDLERRNFDAALRILFLAGVADLDRLADLIKPFEFIGDTAPMGLYLDREDQPTEIRISRKVLGSLPSTLGTMIHEVAHEYGSDGSIEHRSQQELIWEKVSGVMLEMLGTDWLF